MAISKFIPQIAVLIAVIVFEGYSERVCFKLHLDKGSDDPGNENTTLFIEKSWDFYDCAHKCKTAENVTCEAFFFDKSASNCYGYEDALNDTLMIDHNGDSYGQRVNC